MQSSSPEPDLTTAFAMERGPGERPTLPAAELRALSRPDGRIAGLKIAFEWGLIVAAAVLCERFWHPVLYVGAVVWIGSRQHALAVLAHDGAHGLLLRNRARNDLVARLFLAWPLLMAFDAYRTVHVQHHRHLNTLDDPDWARNRPDRLETNPGWWEFARILLGLSGNQKALLDVVRAGEATERASRLDRLRWPLTALVVVGFVATGHLSILLLYWCVPLFSWFLFSMRLKGTAEHFAVERRHGASASRTVLANPLERWLIAPNHVHYHAEHHLFPGVPCYRLPELHARLMQDPTYRAQIHLTKGYAGYLRECLALRRRPAPQPATP